MEVSGDGLEGEGDVDCGEHRSSPAGCLYIRMPPEGWIKLKSYVRATDFTNIGPSTQVAAAFDSLGRTS